MAEEVSDSPSAWVARHIRRFIETNGHPRPGVNDLLLTTRGRKTGRLRRTALVYVRDGDSYVLAASDAGSDRHPSWYLNLLDDPEVVLEVGGERFPAVARTATPEEKPRLWRSIAAAMPSYQDYQDATAREIPVVVVDRRAP
ncbi:nitroreductase family deazaflavin-dependent oxidoreductase [Rhizohabitans arisaemae]|uniref:nitroreductase family deazaflavin-dependent oxidoreductase n=1 Tax=Rhizohabitans arisaemae TaxID=2720610 RepID=UPI0024B05EB2|nr:nitroreductase family deazaflavin-dependent oxidoreductase [Rhizohabitans arisaemae]